MKTKKKKMFGYLAIIAIIAVGAIITFVIDHLLGVNFDNVSLGVLFSHKFIYMLWGGAIVGTVNWLAGLTSK